MTHFAGSPGFAAACGMLACILKILHEKSHRQFISTQDHLGHLIQLGWLKRKLSEKIVYVKELDIGSKCNQILRLDTETTTEFLKSKIEKNISFNRFCLNIYFLREEYPNL